MLKDSSLVSNTQVGDIDKREILLNLFILNFKKICREVFFYIFFMKNFNNFLQNL